MTNTLFRRLPKNICWPGVVLFRSSSSGGLSLPAAQASRWSEALRSAELIPAFSQPPSRRINTKRCQANAVPATGARREQGVRLYRSDPWLRVRNSWRWSRGAAVAVLAVQRRLLAPTKPKQRTASPEPDRFMDEVGAVCRYAGKAGICRSPSGYARLVTRRSCCESAAGKRSRWLASAFPVPNQFIDNAGIRQRRRIS